MFSRRLLRIKIMQGLYSYFKTGDKSMEVAERELFVSLHRSYHLYHLLLLLIVALSFHARKKIEQAREKKIPTKEDLDPNERFINNRIILQVENNKNLKQYIQSNSLGWSQSPELIRTLFQLIEESDCYRNYMSLEAPSYEDDKRVITEIYQDVLNTSDALYQSLEEQSIFWNDEVDYIILMIIKTLNEFGPDDPDSKAFMPEFRDDEDLDFTRDMLRKTILRQDETLEYIKRYTDNWDAERLAFIDLLLMQMAITEMIEFPFIPTKVTLNEYIDIAKYYSTRNSNVFINGVLDKITHFLKKEKIIVKKGKGLIGENE